MPTPDGWALVAMTEDEWRDYLAASEGLTRAKVDALLDGLENCLDDHDTIGPGRPG